MSTMHDGRDFSELTNEEQDEVFDDPEITFSREGILEMLDQVAETVEADVTKYQGAPVEAAGPWIAELSAGVQAIARALKLHIEGRLK